MLPRGLSHCITGITSTHPSPGSMFQLMASPKTPALARSWHGAGRTQRDSIPWPGNQCLTWKRQGKQALISNSALDEVTHEPQCVSVLNRPAQVIIPSWKQQIPGKRSHSTPERGKQRDATKVSDSRFYFSLTSASIMHLAEKVSLFVPKRKQSLAQIAR